MNSLSITGKMVRISPKEMEAEFATLFPVVVAWGREGAYEVYEDEHNHFHASLYYFPTLEEPKKSKGKSKASKKASKKPLECYRMEVESGGRKVYWMALSRLVLKMVARELNPLEAAKEDLVAANLVAANLVANAKGKPAKAKAKGKASRIMEAALSKVEEAKEEAKGLIAEYKANGNMPGPKALSA